MLSPGCGLRQRLAPARRRPRPSWSPPGRSTGEDVGQRVPARPAGRPASGGASSGSRSPSSSSSLVGVLVVVVGRARTAGLGRQDVRPAAARGGRRECRPPRSAPAPDVSSGHTSGRDQHGHQDPGRRTRRGSEGWTLSPVRPSCTDPLRHALGLRRARPSDDRTLVGVRVGLESPRLRGPACRGEEEQRAEQDPQHGQAAAANRLSVTRNGVVSLPAAGVVAPAVASRRPAPARSRSRSGPGR